MRGRGIRPLIGLCLVLLAATSGYAPSASAALSKTQNSNNNVTQKLSIQYSTTRCLGYEKYKINMVGRRWYRSTTNRTVRVYQATTVADGMKCNEDLVSLLHSKPDWTPCFGCDGYNAHWTAPYDSFYDWPYVGDPINDVVGAALQSRVRNPSGDTLGHICSRIALSGNINC